VALLPIPQPYDFEISTERFRAFGPDLANLWHEGGLHRVVDGREVRIEAAAGGVDVSPAAKPPVRASGSGEGAPGNREVPLPLGEAALAEVRHLLGLPFDLEPFRAFAAGEPVLARLEPALRGFRPPLAPSAWETLVTSITAQQVSLFAAFAIRNRLIERYGERAGHAYAFPAPERVAAADEDALLRLGFSRRKAEYVLGLARGGLAGLDGAASLADDEIKARIVAVRGLGEWTADWFLARHLARPRAWPAGDLGLRKAVSAFYGDGRPLTTGEVRAIGARFEPFQNLAAHYLLTGLRTVGP
jgi:DNA-3-methyladenine glycosylase II